MTTSATEDPKSVAYYSAAVTAWFTTSLEYDKSLLTLSAAGIGLHLTLLTTVGVKSSEALVLYLAAVACFAVSLLIALRVLRLNQDHIEGIILARITDRDPALGLMDRIASYAFGVGVVLTAVVAAGAAIDSFTEKGKTMAEKPQAPSSLGKSVNGAARIQPGDTFVGNSFNGAASIQPATSQVGQQTTTSQAPASAPASAPVAPAPSGSSPPSGG
jgi:hypothetical protein